MSKYEELSKLKELLDAGVLSKEEFEAEKKKILDASEEVKPTSTKKPGFFSKEAARQRQEAFEKLPKAEQQAKAIIEDAKNQAIEERQEIDTMIETEKEKLIDAKIVL